MARTRRRARRRDNRPEAIFGWGREFFTTRQNLDVELREHEKNQIRFGEAIFEPPPPRIRSTGAEVREQKIREEMPFDEGWTFVKAEEKVYGSPNKRGPQALGNCVGYSQCLLLAAKIAHEILIEGDAEDVLGDSRSSPVPYIPYSYGAGRCLSGNMCGGGDGSYCSVQLRASMDHGFLPSDTPGLEGDVPQGSSRTGRHWGSSRSTLNKWRPKAINFKLEHSHRVQSENAMWKTIVDEKQPVQICSNWGFRAGQKMGWDGFDFHLHRRSGSWAHSMQVLAAFASPLNGDRFYMIGNQWGNYHKDGWWFVVSGDTMAAWLRQADARSVGEIKGRELILDLPM